MSDFYDSAGRVKYLERRLAFAEEQLKEMEEVAKKAQDFLYAIDYLRETFDRLRPPQESKVVEEEVAA